MQTYETPRPITLSVRAGSGHVTVVADDTQRTTVELTPLNSAGEDAVAEATVEQRGESVAVVLPRHRGLFRQGPQVAVAITVPTGSTLEVKAEACDVRASGGYASAAIDTGSGDIAVERVDGSARLKSGSGTVTAGEVGGTLVVGTGSGDVNLDHTAGSTSINVGSGDISIGEVSGEVVTRTGSGDVEVGILGGSLVTKSGSGDLTVRRAAHGAVRANGASGNISIGICEGTAAWLDVSTLTGRVTQELGEATAPREDQRRVEITAHTVSGDLRVHRS
jgi:DUF4097 and DUF4098 domain-containing protein YvlB